MGNLVRLLGHCVRRRQSVQLKRVHWMCWTALTPHMAIGRKEKHKQQYWICSITPAEFVAQCACTCHGPSTSFFFTKATSSSLVAKVLSKPRWCGRVFAAGMVSAEDTSRIQAEGYLGRFFRWISWPAWFVLVLLFMCAGGLK